MMKQNIRIYNFPVCCTSTVIRLLTEAGYEVKRMNLLLDDKCVKAIEVNWN